MRIHTFAVFAFAIAVLIAAAGGGVSRAVAADAPAASASPAASPSASPAPPSPTPSPPFFSGFIDAAYSNLDGSGFFSSGTASRVFDTQLGTTIVHTVNFTLQRVPSAGFGGRFELNAGSDANVIMSYPTFNTQSGIDITQAYLTYTNNPGNFTFTAGKFVTLAGAEVIRSPDNTNYSRSILFGYAIPFTHTGVRGSYTINDKATVILGVNNGWDDVKDTNGSKTFEAALALTPTKTLTLNLNTYNGTEQVTNYPVSKAGGNRSLFDAVASYKPPGPVSYVLNYDYGTQQNAPLLDATGTQTGTGSARWYGLAGYVNYAISSLYSASLRSEYMTDKHGYRTGLAQDWYENTFTLGYAPQTNLLLRAEIRADRSNITSFVKKNGSLSKNQSSFAFEAVVKY